VRLVVFGFFLFLSLKIIGQESQPFGFFQSDSVLVGKPLPYTLFMNYPVEWQVIFPDSNFDFTPFEVIDINYFPTKSDSINSFDSVIYTFLSFSIDSVQSLSLPVTIITGKDSFSIPTKPSQVLFKDLIPVVSDSLTVKSNTDQAFLERIFNYPRLFWGLGIGLTAVLLVLIFFGKRILMFWNSYLLKRRHKKFLLKIREFQISSNERVEKSMAENFEKFWKKYLESLSSFPYNSLTTKEISKLKDHEIIISDLRDLDNFVYGDKPISNWRELLIELQHFAEDRYFKKQASIKSRKK
jgi:hypothetical protein